MSDAIGLIGFYFTLIGFIAGLFFTRIDGWFGSVQVYLGKVKRLPEQKALQEKYYESEMEEKGLRASAPIASFIAVGVFVSALCALAYFVPIDSDSANPDPVMFLYVPLTATVVAYWLGGIILLWQGKRLLNEAKKINDKGISG